MRENQRILACETHGDLSVSTDGLGDPFPESCPETGSTFSKIDHSNLKDSET